MVLRYSYHCGQMIFGVNDLHDRSYDSGTLVARTYKNQQIFTDTHLGPWGQYRTYDNLQSTVTAYDKSIVGVVMGWGSDNQWYKTAAY